VTPLAGAAAGVTVVVMSGLAQAPIRIDCISAATPTAAAPPRSSHTLHKVKSLLASSGPWISGVSPRGLCSQRRCALFQGAFGTDYVVLVTPVTAVRPRVTAKTADGFGSSAVMAWVDLDFLVLTR
jgi:hypothetical protein